MKDKKPHISTWIVIVIIILVLIFLLSFGKADFLSVNKEDKKLKLKERKEILENRYTRIQDILTKRKALKKKLDTICKWVLFGVRLLLALLLIAILVLIGYYRQCSIIELFEYVGVATFLVVLIGFVVKGIPTGFFDIWKFFKKRLTLMIYGKYIDIDKHIASQENELQQIDADKTKIEKEIMEMEAAETEIKNILKDIDPKNDQRL